MVGWNDAKAQDRTSDQANTKGRAQKVDGVKKQTNKKAEQEWFANQRLEKQEKGAPEIRGRDEKREKRFYLKVPKLQLLKVQKKIKNSWKVSKLNKQAHAANYKADQSDRKKPTKLEFTAKPGCPWTETIWEKIMWVHHTLPTDCLLSKHRDCVNQNSSWSSLWLPLGCCSLMRTKNGSSSALLPPQLSMSRQRPHSPGKCWVVRMGCLGVAKCILGDVTSVQRGLGEGTRQGELFVEPLSSSLPISNCL